MNYLKKISKNDYFAFKFFSKNLKNISQNNVFRIPSLYKQKKKKDSLEN